MHSPHRHASSQSASEGRPARPVTGGPRSTGLAAGVHAAKDKDSAKSKEIYGVN